MNQDAAGIPEFAILGHPNEGKSSLVSTLSEDDSVRISPYPGETTECRIFPVIIDGRETIRFTDTPGFQTPRRTLAWFEAYQGPRDQIIRQFIREHLNDPACKDETRLLTPVLRGAGIIYVADGSRPMRKSDVAEMKILALTGRPRMAVINNKTNDNRFIPDWEKAFAEHFQVVIHFNAHRASYRERILLLRRLGTLHEDFSEPVAFVIDAFKKEWHRRNVLTSETILDLLETCMNHTVSQTIQGNSGRGSAKELLRASWHRDVNRFEQQAHQKIRKLFKHNIFNILLPERSILEKDLFDSSTWRILGLSRTQLAATAATVGGTAAMVLDLATAGHSLGLFALIGGAAGAGAALLGTRKIAKTRVLGQHLGGFNVTVGPCRDIRFMFILLDRALLFYSHIINWAHGKRAVSDSGPIDTHNIDLTSHWPQKTRNVFARFFSSLNDKNPEVRDRVRRQTGEALLKILDDIPDKNKI